MTNKSIWAGSGIAALATAALVGQMIIIGGPPKVGPAFPIPEAPPTYYVRTDGHDTNCNGTTNAAAASAPNCAWLTINKAADTLTAGDIGRVQAGDYVETVSVSVSGTSGSTVTLVADGEVNVCRFTFTGQSYVRLIGFDVDGSLGGCTAAQSRINSSADSTGLEFWNVAVNNGNFGYHFANSNSFRCTACIWVGGSVTDVNNGTYGLAVFGDDVFVGYIAFDQINYLGVVPSGHRQRFVNLNFSNMDEDGELERHTDMFFTAANNSHGWSNNLVESVFAIGTPSAKHNKFSHGVTSAGGTCSPGECAGWADNVWRFMVSHDLGSAALWSLTGVHQPIERYRYYNNTLVYGSQDPFNASGIACGTITTASVSIYNHLFYRCWGDSATTNIAPWNISAFTFAGDYNLAYDPDATVTFHASSGWAAQANEQSNVDPKLVDAANDDFTLAVDSGARGTGGPLTAAVGAAAGGSSTSLTVTAGTGSFFLGSNAANLPQYGGALVPGDFITVGATTVQVASRAGDVLTLATAINWADADPIYYGTSATVDIGAYPYKAGGYTLSATYLISANRGTVTPNDASLVRFVVCYDDGVPVQVLRESPYVCNPVSGTFSARVYPRYASTTLWVEATEE